MTRRALINCLFPLAALLFSCSLAPCAAGAELQQADVFVSGQDGYHTYRIPAMVVSRQGIVLAFCEGRKTSSKDYGDIDLLLRRSFDNARTWGPIQVVHEEGGSQSITIGNPCPIVAADGTVHVVFTRNNQRAFYSKSTDQGASFSPPREISASLDGFDFAWNRLGTGPGHGIQARSGRLLVPLWLNDRIHENYRSAVAYSDDGGVTWKPGGVVAADFRGCNECSVAELADGRLLLNMRNRQAKCRAVATSTDGGASWSRPRLVEKLEDPGCQGALLRLPGPDSDRLLFSNAASTKRVQMTVRLSEDGGKTWPVRRLIYPGPSAYSDLAATADGTILCLYECGEKSPYQKIRVARFGLDWLQEDSAESVREYGATDPGDPVFTKTERFDRDPGWDGFRNRLMPKVLPTITQDLGYCQTNFAGKEKGEMGGRVCRSATPACYAAKIARKTLNDRLSASGSFAISASGGTSGVFFGWFNAEQPGASGRPINSLGLNLDGEPRGGRLAVRLIGNSNKSCGTFITPYIPGKYRPTPIRNDGTRYTWTLDYDPDASNGNGRFQFTITSTSATPEAFEGKTFSVDLPAGFKQEGAVFDRFGLMNMLKSGNPMTIHFDDLAYNGQIEDFSQDPGWQGSGNQGTYQNLMPSAAHDFGYSAGTNFAGGTPGEIGGIFWRTGKDWGYYADRVGPLTLDDRLEASGRVTLVVGGPDADMCLGWFRGEANDAPPMQAGHFLGVHVGGPTRVGHYFQPACTTAQGTRLHADQGPLLVPGKTCQWALLYDPTAQGGKGAIRVTLGEESVVLDLKQGRKKEGAQFDRFGLLSAYPGGQVVKIYLDDLKYTAGARRAPKP